MPVKAELDGSLKACGDKVVIRKLEETHEVKRNGIIIPQSAVKGFNMLKGRVESIGPEINKGCLNVGDVVLFDYYSTYGETSPLVVTKIENVIAVLEEE